MSVRLFAVMLVVVLIAGAQADPGWAGRLGVPLPAGPAVRGLAPLTVVAQDDNENGNDNSADDEDDDNDEGGDNNGGGDNGGGDDDDDDDDNGNDNRNENDDGDDNGNGNDNGGDNASSTDSSTTVATATPTPTVVVATPTPRPTPTLEPYLTEASATSDGGEAAASIGRGRVVARLLPGSGSGVTVAVRFADPAGLTPVPGRRAGDLVFVVEAFDAGGHPLGSLPTEVNLNVRYDDGDVAGLDEERLVISRLDPAANTWRPAPKLIRDSVTNYLAASITELGAYAVHVP